MPAPLPSSIPICLFTFDRRPAVQYINDSLRSLSKAVAESPVGPVHVLIDGAQTSFIDSIENFPVEIHPVGAERWEEIGKWHVHKRIGYSYMRAFDIALAAGAPGVLICEDDVEFRPKFPLMLCEVLEDMAKGGRTHSLLTLYSSQNFYTYRSLDRGRFYGKYITKYFFGGQAVYFPREILRIAIEFWSQWCVKAPDNELIPNDLLVAALGAKLECEYGEQGGLYRCYVDLVNHVGRHSETGLGEAFHSSHTFIMPWTGVTQ